MVPGTLLRTFCDFASVVLFITDKKKEDYMFLTKILMLTMFILGVSFGWASMSMQFVYSLYNIILGILSVFFLLRGFELADKINGLGQYTAEKAETAHNDEKETEDTE